jgi:acetyltransferase-like isoleucine patch superfamily enzyme
MSPPSVGHRVRSLARVAAELVEGTRYLRADPAPVGPPAEAFGAFGLGSLLIPPCEISGASRITIGSNVVVGEMGVLLAIEDGEIAIGDDVLLERAVYVASAASVTIADRVRSAGSVSIVDCWYHPSLADGRWPPTPADAPPPAPVVIGEDVRIGTGAIIMPGTTIGARAHVRAGAVVYTDVPEDAVAHGNPATILEGDQRG